MNTSVDKAAKSKQGDTHSALPAWLRTLLWIRNREKTVLIIVFLSLTAIWGFIELSSEVFEGETEKFDTAILLSMRNADDLSDPVGPPWAEEMGRDITALGGVTVISMVTLAVLGYLLMSSLHRLALVVFVATAGALLVSTVLKQSFDRPRPDLVPHNAYVYTSSFPSGHSMQAASTYLTMGALLASVQRRRRARVFILSIAIITTVLVGISRVYLGVHWPSDVLAGWTAGSVWALLCWLLLRGLQRHRKVESSTD